MSKDTLPIILAIDTCTEACSVALETGDGIIHRHEEIPRGHAGRLLPMIDDVLAQAGVQRSGIALIACGQGPGSFTGVRISLSAAQGLSLALDVPVVGFSTLAVLAAGCHRRTGATHILPAVDARMGEVYWGAYRIDETSSLPVLATEETVTAPRDARWPEQWRRATAVGTGWLRHGEGLLRPGCTVVHDTSHLPCARDLLPLARDALTAGRTLEPASLQPVYLRDQVTHQAGR